MPRKVMVTGGGGFIGSHLVEALLGRGDQVHVFDVMPLAEARNLVEVRDHPGLTYHQGDIRDRRAVAEFYQGDADLIYHLASVVGIKRYLADPLALIDISVGGTRLLLELAREHGTRFLFASTSEVFGKNPAVPWSEESDRVLGPTSVDRWSYSTSKATCEHMLWGLYRQGGLPFTIVRFFNVYGPRQNPIFVISQSIHRALRGESPLLYDGGGMTRSFTFVRDVVEGVILASEKAEAIGEDFNLGNTAEVTIKEVVEEICRQVGGVDYEQFDTRQKLGDVYEDIPRRVPSAAKAERLLGWRASTQVGEGIRQVIAWAEANRWWLEAAAE